MSYTPDIGAALAVLGTDDRARGRTWHVPTAPALTGEEYLAMATGGRLSYRTMSMGTMRFGGLFSGAARETLEMAYQYTAPYLLDSSSFERTTESRRRRTTRASRRRCGARWHRPEWTGRPSSGRAPDEAGGPRDYGKMSDVSASETQTTPPLQYDNVEP